MDDVIWQLIAILLLAGFIVGIIAFVWGVWTLSVMLVLVFALGQPATLGTLLAATGIGILGCAITGALGGRRYVIKE